MDATKQFDIQRQIRNNNEVFHQYARELKLWEAEMKRKDRELGEQSSIKVQDVPPIRKKSKKEVTTVNQEKPQRISAFDYSSWEKFDVVKVCEEMDKEDSDEDEDTDVEEEDLDRIATAVYNKEQGNKLVKEGKWGEAIEKYNVAIQIYPHDAVFYANRALCFLKMKNYVSAEADCTTSLRLDISYVKAYQRRAAARRSLSQFQEARKDMLKVLQLEPNNKQAEIELAELNRILNIPIDKSPKTSSSSIDTKNLKEKANKMMKSSSNIAHAITLETPPDHSWVPSYDSHVYSPVPRHSIPPHKRSKKPLIKINIETKSSRPLTFDSTHVIEEKTKNIRILDDEEKVDFQPIKKEEENKNKVDPASESEERRKKFEILESAWNELQNANPYKKISDKNETVRKEKNVKVNKVQEEPQVKTVVIPSAPKTCSQFELHWRTLKSSEENLYQYLKQINGRQLPGIFQEGLDTVTFIDIVKCLCGKFIERGDNIGDYLEGLARTPRLGSLVMLMSQSEKSLLSNLLQYCEEKNQLNKTELERLKLTFEL